MNYAAPFIDGYNAVNWGHRGRTQLHTWRALDPFRGLPAPECGGLADGMDEEPPGREREFRSRVERRAEEAGILAYGDGGLRGQRGIYRNRQSNRY